jgi:HD-like signal output (HDOD) protein
MHSMAVAFGSRLLANKKAPELSNDAFSAGLIHDAGKLILNSHVLERQADFEMAMSTGEETFLAAEKEILGFDHAEIASEACAKWNIPEALAVGIRYHHDPSESDDNKLAHVLHISDSIAMMSGIGTGIDGMLYQMDENSMEILSVEADELSDLMEEIADYVGKMEQEMED